MLASLRIIITLFQKRFATLVLSFTTKGAVDFQTNVVNRFYILSEWRNDGSVAGDET
jgi:hypothetical protein